MEVLSKEDLIRYLEEYLRTIRSDRQLSTLEDFLVYLKGELEE